MCFGKKKAPLPENRPVWVTHSRTEVARAEIEAAEIHYTYLQLLAEDREKWVAFGDEEHHTFWYDMHIEAAWWADPEYTWDRLEGVAWI